MDALLEHLEEVIGQTRATVAETLGAGQAIAASDDQILRTMTLAAELQRLTEAVLVETVGEVSRRSVQRDRELRLTTRRGCHDVGELVQRLTRLAPATAARMLRGARPTMVAISFAGEPMAPHLPAIRDALIDGELGVDGLLAIAGPLTAMKPRVGRDDLLAADAVLAAEARGEGPSGEPPACAESLRVQALVWSAYLDQDGAEPLEDRAIRLRGITLGATRDGLVPIRGMLLPEVAAQLRRISDAVNSPRVDGDRGVSFRPSTASDESGPVDPRTWTQKQHDALATALSVAASSELLPTIGGAAPTLIVSVRDGDLVSQTGWAHIDGCDEPVSRAVAQHAGCAGVIQRVLLGDDGRIKKIGTEERVFNRHQRRAIALRDGGCLIPGCGVPAGWCEVHHVTEHAAGGPTHTDNGVLLCWAHHRLLDHIGWRIRMDQGVPEVLAPPWIDPRPRWRPVTKSRTRMLDTFARRRT
ncbi:DUF222 domain-containing protein [Planococcus sp. APC 4015]|nr:DUF222 domain-containing protein [Planococcus sp. APC 4015]